MKVAFIGPKQYAKSFIMIGFDAFEVESQEEAKKKIKDLKDKEYGIIFTSNDILEKEIEGVVVLPGLKGKSDNKFLKEIMNKALGKEIKIK